MLRNAFDQGWRAALARYKLAANAAPPAQLNPAQASATAMPAIQPKSLSPATAPVAAHADKANILG